MNEQPTFIELFAGIGGLRLGLERAGWKCVWSNELDKHASKAYRKNFGEKELHEGDIRKVDEKSIPNHDLLVGGFPCQSFSLAGKRQGFNDIRGTLFFEVARIIESKRPRLLLLENVKGLLSAQGGYCFFRILQILDELGYDVEWQVLNSKYFGVPQSRERVFIIGHLRSQPSREVFLATHTKQNFDDSRSKEGGEFASTLSTKQDRGRPTLIEECIPILTPNRNEKRQNGRRCKNDGDPSFTLTSQDRNGVLLNVERHPLIRFLTPLECERLQGFPDGWTIGFDDTLRYKMLGNAVTVPVIQFLGEHLLACNQRSET